MSPLPHYAMVGSLVAGAAGAIILAIVTIIHGLRRREPVDTARRGQLLRLADTAAVLCFAVAAGLGVVALMRQSHGVPPGASSEEGAVAERLQALETRIADAELKLQVRTPPPAELRAWEDRVVRLERQVGAIERSATAAARREERPRPASVPAARKVAAPAAWTPLVTSAPAASAMPPATTATAAPAPTTAPAPPSAAPRLAPPTAASAEAGATQAPAPSAPAPASTVPIPPEPQPPRAERPAPVERPARVEDLPLGEKLRRDWDEIKREARRGGDDWREAWDQLKRLFRP